MVLLNARDVTNLDTLAQEVHLWSNSRYRP